MTETNPFSRPSLIPRIYPWINGNNDFRENNFVLLEKHHRPNTECWYEGAAPFRHTAHICKQDPNLSDLVALGNHLSDRTNWMFEAIGKLNVSQAEIANESILKIDLITHTVEQIYKGFLKILEKLSNKCMLDLLKKRKRESLKNYFN